VVGFVGLGNMGLPMAASLLRAGYRLAVCDRLPSAVAALAAQGARACATPREVSEAPGVTAVVTMLPSTEAVRLVYLGPDGILAAGGGLRAAVLVDCSTIYPGCAAELAAAVAAAPLHAGGAAAAAAAAAGGGGAAGFVDAPVSGGVPGAQAATLTFMVRRPLLRPGACAAGRRAQRPRPRPAPRRRPLGPAARRPQCGGSEEALARAAPFLRAMGRRTVHCGAAAGAGQAAKLCNNLALGDRPAPARPPARLPACPPARLPACLPACPPACLHARLPACPPACLPACPPACPPACLPARLPACLPACPPARPPACLPARLPARLPACPPARLPACPPACLPACPPARLPACPPACPPARLPACLPACSPAPAP
jgi:3-hydroxyisobutyrate dehydrogenase-like beta-hydroxyacid dehydrogenase